MYSQSEFVKHASGFPVKHQDWLQCNHTQSQACTHTICARRELSELREPMSLTKHTLRERQRQRQTKKHKHKGKYRQIKRDRQADTRGKQQEKDTENNKELKREMGEGRQRNNESHLTLAHLLFFLGFYLLVQGFPSKQRLQHRTIGDTPFLLQRSLVV